MLLIHEKKKMKRFKIFLSRVLYETELVSFDFLLVKYYVKSVMLFGWIKYY